VQKEKFFWIQFCALFRSSDCWTHSDNKEITGK
jgi:hypothetical protein